MLIYICYWNDGSWCYEDELREYSHKEPNWSVMSVPYTHIWEDIDELVKKIVCKEIVC